MIPVSKKEAPQVNKFAYNFQPAPIPQMLPFGKLNRPANLGVGLGFLPLPRPNTLLRKDVVL